MIVSIIDGSEVKQLRPFQSAKWARPGQLYYTVGQYAVRPIWIVDHVGRRIDPQPKASIEYGGPAAEPFIPKKPADDLLREVHIVWADLEYSGSAMVRIFVSMADAVAFRDRCNAYQATKLPPPSDEAMLSDESPEFDRWFEAETKWREAHPAGSDNSYYDAFSISTWQVTAASCAG